MELNLLVIRTGKPKELSAFYEMLGIVFEYNKHGKGPMHYSGNIGNLLFEIYPLSKSQQEADKMLRLGFEVKNLEELLSKLKGENVKIIQEAENTGYGKIAIIEDIDGRKIELKEKQELK